MRRHVLAYGAWCIVILLVRGVTAPAEAHAVLQSSTPQSGEQVPSGMLNMTFRFNSRIDKARSQLILVRPDQSQAGLKILTDDDRPDRLSARADLSPGSYTMRWQVLAIDGHITRGNVAFTVRGR